MHDEKKIKLEILFKGRHIQSIDDMIHAIECYNDIESLGCEIACGSEEAAENYREYR